MDNHTAFREENAKKGYTTLENTKDLRVGDSTGSEGKSKQGKVATISNDSTLIGVDFGAAPTSEVEYGYMPE